MFSAYIPTKRVTYHSSACVLLPCRHFAKTSSILDSKAQTLPTTVAYPRGTWLSPLNHLNTVFYSFDHVFLSLGTQENALSQSENAKNDGKPLRESYRMAPTDHKHSVLSTPHPLLPHSPLPLHLKRSLYSKRKSKRAEI